MQVWIKVDPDKPLPSLRSENEQLKADVARLKDENDWLKKELATYRMYS